MRGLGWQVISILRQGHLESDGKVPPIVLLIYGMIFAGDTYRCPRCYWHLYVENNDSGVKSGDEGYHIAWRA